MKKKRQQQGYGDYYLKPAEVRQLIQETETLRDKCLIKTLAYTGLRREEAVNLNIEDIDFETERIIVQAGKGNKSRMVPASKSLLTDLKFLIDMNNRIKGPLFISQKKNRLSPRQASRVVADAGKRARLTNPNPNLIQINPHILRHSYGRNFLRAGGEPRILQQLLGHSSISTTLNIYGVPSMNDLQKEYEEIFESIYDDDT